jgi:hypothetical protein
MQNSNAVVRTAGSRVHTSISSLRPYLLAIFVNLLALAGMGSITYAGFLIYQPIGLVVAGLFMLASAYLLTMEDSGANAGRSSMRT